MNKEIILGKVINPCFPRSGHRLLKNMLMEYFGDELLFHSKMVQRNTFDQSNYIKNHDNELLNSLKTGIEINDSWKYVVQFRHPIMSIVSYFEFHIRTRTHLNNQQEFLSFLNSRINYWKRFIQKWTLTQPNFILIPYEQLIEDPLTKIGEVVRFMTESERIDMSKLMRSMEKHRWPLYRYKEDEKAKNISEPRKLADFKYYDQGLFEDVERKLFVDYLKPLEIRPLLMQST